MTDADRTEVTGDCGLGDVDGSRPVKDLRCPRTGLGAEDRSGEAGSSVLLIVDGGLTMRGRGLSAEPLFGVDVVTHGSSAINRFITSPLRCQSTDTVLTRSLSSTPALSSA